MKVLLSTALIVFMMFTNASAQKEKVATEVQDQIEVAVTRVLDGEFQLQMGTSQGIRSGDSYELIRMREGSLFGQYDILGIIVIGDVSENSAWCSLSEDREKIDIREGDVLLLRWIRESEMINRQRNRRFFFALEAGWSQFAESVTYDHPISWSNDAGEYYGDNFEVTSGQHFGLSLGFGLSKRVDLLGSFTLMKITSEGVETYYEQDPPDTIHIHAFSEEEYASAYSLNTRITFPINEKINSHIKLGAWMQEDYRRDDQSEYGGGILLGVGARLKVARSFSFLLEADAPIAFDDRLGTRIRVTIIPELTVVSW